MRNKYQSSSVFSKLRDPIKAFSLKRGVSHREDLVEQKNVRIEVGRDGESQPDVHAGRVALYRHIDVTSHAGELDNAFQFAPDFGAAHSKHRAVEVNILHTGELGMKA